MKFKRDPGKMAVLRLTTSKADIQESIKWRWGNIVTEILNSTDKVKEVNSHYSFYSLTLNLISNSYPNSCIIKGIIKQLFLAAVVVTKERHFIRLVELVFIKKTHKYKQVTKINLLFNFLVHSSSDIIFASSR